MNDEVWSPWVPIEGLLPKYYIDAVLDTMEHLKVILSDENESHQVQIIFETSARSYEHTNESFCHQIIADLYKNYGHDFFAKWTFFKIANSSYIQRLSVQAPYSGINKFTHFCFVASDSLLHILSYEDPQVIRIEKTKKK